MAVTFLLLFFLFFKKTLALLDLKKFNKNKDETENTATSNIKFKIIFSNKNILKNK